VTTWKPSDYDRVVPSDGSIELYHQYDGSWSPTIDHDGGIPIKGLRITLSSMTKPDSYLEVIEMSPRYEMDLSDKIIDMDYSASMSETSFAAPIGELSSNEASVTLDNFDGSFNREANDDKFFLDGHQRFIDKNVKMTGFISYDVSPALGDDIGYHEFEEDVRLFTMYVDGQWAGQGVEQLSLNLKDYSTFFQGLRPPKVLYEILTAAEIIWRLCDLVGFVDYEIDLGQRGITIPYFWADGEKTLWELFSE